MIYTVCKLVGETHTVVDEEGNVIASFSGNASGDLAYQMFCVGLLRTTHSLFDADRNQFMIGTIAQLTQEIQTVQN